MAASIMVGRSQVGLSTSHRYQVAIPCNELEHREQYYYFTKYCVATPKRLKPPKMKMACILYALSDFRLRRTILQWCLK